MDYPFKGPSLLKLVLSVPGAAALGAAYAFAAQTPYRSTVLLLTIREIADCVFYNFFAKEMDEEEDARLCAEVYAFTNLSVNIGAVFLFRKYELIGKVGTLFLSFLIFLETVSKVADFPKYRISMLQ